LPALRVACGYAGASDAPNVVQKDSHIVAQFFWGGLFFQNTQEKIQMNRRSNAGAFALVVLIVLLTPQMGNCAQVSQAVQGSSWSPTSDCSTCHAKYVASMKDDTLLVSKHAKLGFDKCSSCHDDEKALAQTHANVNGVPTFMKARRYPQEFCLRCHGSLADLAKRTATSKVLTDVNGKVVNPHDLPKTPAHAKAQDCSNCHKMHKKPMDAMAFCVGCHHKQEFACTKCHANQK
jgi:hypothetical protein